MNQIQPFQGHLSEHILPLLNDAGYDTSLEEEKEKGILAYHCAFRIWETYKRSRELFLTVSRKKTIGRNDVCSCNSGRKYKKCCLKKNEEQASALSFQKEIIFSPALIPQLTKFNIKKPDFLNLEKIIRQHKKLNSISFSSEYVEKFLTENFSQGFEEDSIDQYKNDQELNELASKYLMQSGDQNILGGLGQKLILATYNAKNEEELRALALGYSLTNLYEMQERRDDHTEEPNALHVLFFYKTIEKILTRKSIMKKIEKHLENKEELSEILKTQDQSLQKVIESAYGDLTEYEREFLSEIRNSHYQEMIEAITDEEFPVPICYATALPYAMYIRQIGLENSYINEEELQKIQEEVKKELLEEDSKLYLFLLEDWIRNHSETKYSYSQTKWMPFIKTLHHEIMHNLFYFYIEKLFINALEKDNFSVIDEDERKIFQETQKKYIDSTIMEKYADFLEARGWPAIANRTRNYAKRIASEEINFPQDSPTKEQNL